MFGIGVPELILVLLIVLLVFVIPIRMSLYLSRRFPNKRWLAILLSLLFYAWGQLYLPRASLYIVALIAIGVVEFLVTGNFIYSRLLSPLVMWYRLYNAEKANTLTAPIP